MPSRAPRPGADPSAQPVPTGTPRVMRGTRSRRAENDSPDAPALVLIHGLTGSPDWWGPVVPVLARTHRVIRLDLAGHGGPARSPGSDDGLPVHVRRVAAALDGLGVRDAVVAGHATGGLVGTALAEQRPDLVAALALFDTGEGPDAGLPPRWPGRLVAVPGLGRWVGRMLGDDPAGRGPETAARRETDVPDRIVMRVRGMTYLALTAASRDAFNCLGQRELPERLSRLDLPVLAVLGGADHLRRRRTADRYRAVPGLRLELLHSSGETPTPQAPPRAADLLLAFVAGLGADVRRTPG
ncbi:MULTISPECIES: alpha/beta fold hydrolase [Streptomyces]|uniref:alpha/beta fold hydrolase n=1 Tax=Streptomyces TaxID=1883 RepID=UPI001E314B60|nr:MULTISPECIES: alpha/beta fold hydrolase [Streptomyces]UFQ19079.1 alpha/beta hydrolase [Streptomyces huasconensis]WCL88698.1 alpha/beta fold hydrolase [Streptomyces sp. JCM 35825]